MYVCFINYSVIYKYQISDHTAKYQISKNCAYPSKHIHLCEIFHKEKHLLLEKIYTNG